MAILTKNEHERIAEAVREAEKKSGGEIATAVIAESDDYGFQELLFAVVSGVVAFLLLTALSGYFHRFLEPRIWGYQIWHLHTAVFALSLIKGGSAYFLAQLPNVDRVIVPKTKMEEAVRRRARRHFMESGVYDTVDRTGILLFISMLERRVELIADRGIDAQVDPALWKDIVTRLTEGIAADRTADAIVVAVQACGNVLDGRVERRPDDTNELDDEIIELERGS